MKVILSMKGQLDTEEIVAGFQFQIKAKFVI